MIVALFIGALILSLLVHEYGHLLTYRLFGGHPEELSVGIGPKLLWHTDRHQTLWALRAFPIAGYVKADASGLTPQAKGICAFAGPAFSMLLASVAFTANTIVQHEHFVFLGYINATMAVMNLLPIFPLDGGRVFYAWRQTRGHSGEPSALTARVGLFVVLFGSTVLPSALHWHIVPKPKTHDTITTCMPPENWNTAPRGAVATFEAYGLRCYMTESK